MIHAIEEYRCIKALVSDAETETVVDFRDCSVSDSHFVILIDLAVTVDVLVLDVSRLNLAECLGRPAFDICLILEETAGDETLR